MTQNKNRPAHRAAPGEVPFPIGFQPVREARHLPIPFEQIISGIDIHASIDDNKTLKHETRFNA